MRKMALNGYVLHLDLTPITELIFLQRHCANNLNQIAIQANTCGRLYPDERKDYDNLWGALFALIQKLSEVVTL